MPRNSLYSQAEELTALYELIEMDQGEVTEDHEQLMEELFKAIESKTDGVVQFVQSLEDQIASAKNRKKEITSFITARENAIDRVKDYVMSCMDRSGSKSFSGDLFEIKERKPSKVLSISDEKLVPVEYLKTTTSVNKTELTKAVKSGELNIEGIKMIDGNRSIQFKSKSVSKKGA